MDLDPMFHDVPDPEDHRELARLQRIDDVKAQMGTVAGRRFVWSLLVTSKFEGANQSLFRTHGGQASYVLGAYELGKGLAEEIRFLCLEQYSLMVRENSQQPTEVTP